MTRSTLQQMQKAAGSAAAISAVIAGTYNTLHCLQLVRQGRMSGEDAVYSIVKQTALASADSALKAAAATGAVSLTTRVAAGTVAQQAMRGMLTRTAVAGTAVCMVDVIQCMVQVAAGKMTLAELESRTGKNVMQTAGAAAGSSIGVTLALQAGAAAGTWPILAASLGGGLIAGLAVTLAIEHGVEGPYRQALENTAALTAAQQVMRESAEGMAANQRLLAFFTLMDADLQHQTNLQLARVDAAGARMNAAISQL